jgi:hypothetical protein
LLITKKWDANDGNTSPGRLCQTVLATMCDKGS